MSGFKLGTYNYISELSLGTYLEQQRLMYPKRRPVVRHLTSSDGLPYVMMDLETQEEQEAREAQDEQAAKIGLVTELEDRAAMYGMDADA